LRKLPIALVFIVALCGAAAGLTPGQLANDPALAKCTKPDSELIKPGTADSYNAQAKGFNDCLRIYVENENNKIARLRADAGGQFDAIMAGATIQIHDIERAINTAIIQVGIVNGVAKASELPPPGEGLAAFPAPECAKPDDALLKPGRGKKAASLAALDKYEAERQGFETCMRLYIAQARNQVLQIKANAEAGFLRVADDVNPRIHAINVEVATALEDARKASGERDAKVNAIHSPLTADGLSPQSRDQLLSPVKYQPPPDTTLPNQMSSNRAGTESVIVNGTRLPRSADMPTGEGDPDAISCRSPQQLGGSRLMGPEICKRNREWAKLTKNGQNISPDGSAIVAGEKQRTFNPTTCISHTVMTPQGPQVISFNCGTPGGQ
jgi:hypothetical protein